MIKKSKIVVAISAVVGENDKRVISISGGPDYVIACCMGRLRHRSSDVKVTELSDIHICIFHCHVRA